MIDMTLIGKEYPPYSAGVEKRLIRSISPKRSGTPTRSDSTRLIESRT